MSQEYLKVKADILDKSNDSIMILNEDLSVFDKIKESKSNEPCLSKAYPGKGVIFAYYPEYYIIIFQLKKIDQLYYYVEIDSKIKKIKKLSNKYLKVLSLEDLILQNYIRLNSKNQIRHEPDLKKSAIRIPCSIVRSQIVQGNWAKVRCVNDKNQLTGNSYWLYFKNKDSLLVDLRYTW